MIMSLGKFLILLMSVREWQIGLEKKKMSNECVTLVALLVSFYKTFL